MRSIFVRFINVSLTFPSIFNVSKVYGRDFGKVTIIEALLSKKVS